VLTFVNREVNVKLVRTARGCWDVLAVLDDRGECQVLDFIAALGANYEAAKRALLRVLRIELPQNGHPACKTQRCKSLGDEIVEDLARLMEEQRVTRAELARRLGISRAYITKMLGGSANFTLLTMVKLAMALDGAVHIHISDKRAVTRWPDKIPGKGKKAGR